MSKGKTITEHVLDHHYFGNGLYGMINDNKLVANFSNEEVLNYFFTGLDKVIEIKDKNDFEGYLEFFNILPEDINKFLLKYIFPLVHFNRILPTDVFKNFAEKVYAEYKILCKKYNIYC